MVDTSPSQLRGDAPTFQPTPSHTITNASSIPSCLRGNAPTFYTNATELLQTRHSPTTTASSSQLPPQSAFLSRLPGEIRNRIYEFALISPDPIPAIHIAPMTPQQKGKDKCKLNVPALAQTSRQIRRETLALYYAGNTFVFELQKNESAIPASLINGWVKRLARSGMDRSVRRVGCVWFSRRVGGKREVVEVKWSVVAVLGQDDSREERLAKARWEEGLGARRRWKSGRRRQRGPYAILLDGDSAVGAGTGVGSGPGTAESKVVFQVDPPIKGLCEHVLAAYARAFEARRFGKSVRGYGGLLDVLQTVCNFLRPEEADVWPVKVCRSCDG